MILAYGALVLCALCYGLASVFQSVGAKRVEAGDSLDVKGLAKVATQIPYLIGVGLDALGWILSLVALAKLPLFVVSAVVAASIGFVVLFSSLYEKTVPTHKQIGLLVVLALGLVGLAISGAPDSAKQAGVSFTIAMAVVAGLVILGGVLVPRVLRGQAAAATLGALAGIAFGGTALCARSLISGISWHTATNPQAWLLIIFGISGLAIYTAALQRGSVTVATAWLFTAETFPPAIVGVLVFGDRARPGMTLVAIVSFVVTVAAAVGLTLVSPEAEEGIAAEAAHH